MKFGYVRISRRSRRNENIREVCEAVGVSRLTFYLPP